MKSSEKCKDIRMLWDGAALSSQPASQPASIYKYIHNINVFKHNVYIVDNGENKTEETPLRVTQNPVRRLLRKCGLCTPWASVLRAAMKLPNLWLNSA